MSQPDTIIAARRLLATLGAGRAALLQIAAQTLPFDRLVALHVLANADVELLESMHASIDRRVATMRARIYVGTANGAPAPESVDDAPTPHGAATISAPVEDQPPVPVRGRANTRVARAIERAAETTRAGGEPPAVADSVAVEPEPRSAVDAVAAPPVEPAPVELAAVAPPVLAALAEAELPTAIGDTVEEARPPEMDQDEPSGPTLAPEPMDEYTPLGEMLPDDLIDDETADPPSDEPNVGPLRIALPGATGAAPAATVNVRGARPPSPPAARIESEETEDPPSNVEAEGEDVADSDQVGTGESVGSGLRVGADRPGRRAGPPSSAPRLTDDDDAVPTTVLSDTPTAAPAGDDDRVKQMGEEAQSQAERGDLQKAIATFTDVIELRHDRMDAYIGRGRCYLELGDYSSAMSDFQRAEDLQPDRPDAHVAMGDLYFARKEYRRAIEFYDQAVELDGSHAMARCRRGISHYYRKNYRQAFQDLQRAYSLDPEIPNIRKYVQMAVKKMERGD